MKYLLDTCTISDFVKGQPKVLARIKATPPNLLAVSALTAMEIGYGLALNGERARKLAAVLQGFFSVVPTKPDFHPHRHDCVPAHVLVPRRKRVSKRSHGIRVLPEVLTQVELTVLIHSTGGIPKKPIHATRVPGALAQREIRHRVVQRDKSPDFFGFSSKSNRS